MHEFIMEIRYPNSIKADLKVRFSIDSKESFIKKIQNDYSNEIYSDLDYKVIDIRKLNTDKKFVFESSNNMCYVNHIYKSHYAFSQDLSKFYESLTENWSFLEVE